MLPRCEIDVAVMVDPAVIGTFFSWICVQLADTAVMLLVAFT